jgi:hypothetical protein
VGASKLVLEEEEVQELIDAFDEGGDDEGGDVDPREWSEWKGRVDVQYRRRKAEVREERKVLDERARREAERVKRAREESAAKEAAGGAEGGAVGVDWAAVEEEEGEEGGVVPLRQRREVGRFYSSLRLLLAATHGLGKAKFPLYSSEGVTGVNDGATTGLATGAAGGGGGGGGGARVCATPLSAAAIARPGTPNTALTVGQRPPPGKATTTTATTTAAAGAAAAAAAAAAAGGGAGGAGGAVDGSATTPASGASAKESAKAKKLVRKQQRAAQLAAVERKRAQEELAAVGDIPTVPVTAHLTIESAALLPHLPSVAMLQHWVATTTNVSGRKGQQYSLPARAQALIARMAEDEAEAATEGNASESTVHYALPTHTLCTHTLCTHTLCTHTLCTHTLCTHALCTHTLCTHALPTHTLCTHTLCTHTLCTHTLCTRYTCCATGGHARSYGRRFRREAR